MWEPPIGKPKKFNLTISEIETVEYVPEVGDTCEYFDVRWIKVEVVYKSAWVMVLKCLNDTGCARNQGVEVSVDISDELEFRPIQPTALELEIDKIHEWVEINDVDLMCDDDIELIAKYILDRLNKDDE